MNILGRLRGIPAVAARQIRGISGPLPNFLIAGASRSGTASLWHYLRQHPDIFMPRRKEIGFFDNDDKFKLGLAEYRSAFTEAGRQRIIGEATPRYLMQGGLYDAKMNYRFDSEDDAAGRIAATIPSVKSILSLRDPVFRAWSQYRKGRRKGVEPAQTFRMALEDELNGRRTPDTTPCCLIYLNQYHRHVNRWLNLFPNGQTEIIIFEEWTQQTQQTLERLFQFLDVDSGFKPPSLHIKNPGTEVRPHKSFIRHLFDRQSRPVVSDELDTETETFARNIFAEDINKLERLLNRQLNIWTQHARAA